ncbi:Gfo/Idh/MocA family protein [Aureispira anguillae]|uniref:Gfo/Idh/MocA family oxidoreductase n=1 Tax=Aureispira anguillae TaxID=2864201 RepID=A0A915YEF3_9BACT|nr:Gfo/Idh/MocA family oxidoreductase [Aureispira anguillae]BDS11594.1 Gfo/Idh/MocA family oxidoreductase [Aureispira anguillae]
MKIGIVGSGLQANRRLLSIQENPYTEIKSIAGVDETQVKIVAQKANAIAVPHWKNIIEDEEIDIVVICTPPNVHFEIAQAAIKNKKHILCEKPLTRKSSDAQKLVQLAAENKVILKCGFNHRHHPAMIKANELIKSGAIGKPITGRALYGICGRENCEKEWRSDVEITAGGQLMEQGIHCIDLFRWFVGEFEAVSANVATLVFPIAPLEDTATALFHRSDGVSVTVNSSITQWRNRFRLELYGTMGYVEINGLGGSYDVQRLRIGKRDPNGPFKEEVIDYRGGDKSWKNEWNHFVDFLLNGGELLGTGIDGVRASQFVEMAYLAAKKECRIKINPIDYEKTGTAFSNLV